jgi:hypothetical protein
VVRKIEPNKRTGMENLIISVRLDVCCLNNSLLI